MITSPTNPRVKYIRKLSDRKFREERGEFYIEGIKIVGEALEQGVDLVALIYSSELLTSDFGRQLISQAKGKGLEILDLSAEVFQKLSLKENPQGIAAVGRQRFSAISSLLPGKNDLWIACDSVQDPGNLGTILRTGDAAGCRGVILLDHSTDPYDPTALRASMGAIFNLEMVKACLTEFVEWKNKTNIEVVGTSNKASVYYRDYAYSRPMALLMGSEKAGLTSDHLHICDKVVSIPMLGKSDSLNLAVATGIILYEIVHQLIQKVE